MSTTITLPAAQYLRMSTEHQQYSLENQGAAIHRYAETLGLSVVQTYSDGARSGLVLKRRLGLRQLLNDVVSGRAAYKAILVYDISRWGRFLDTDESAHYEFLCKQAGIPVHYCMETFANDGSLPSLMMKALKRTMAGEYSRELSAKVFEGHKRLARLGFKQGGLPGYGLRRMLLSSDGKPKQLLGFKEHKSIATDRIILVPGPKEELEVVRGIYRMFVEQRRSIAYIMRDLNRRGIMREGGTTWKYGTVRKILVHPKYTGCHVYGSTSTKLCTPSVKVPQTDWIVAPAAFEAVIDQATFDASRRVQSTLTGRQTNEVLLTQLRRLLAAKRRLSQSIINQSRTVAAASTYCRRFGTLRQAYELIGYGRPEDFRHPLDLRRRTQALRQRLIGQIQGLFPDEVSIVRRGGRWRNLIQIDNFTVSIRTARALKTKAGIVKWLVDTAVREHECITLLARLTPTNDGIQDLHMFAHFKNLRFSLRLDDKWLDRGTRMLALGEFCKLARLIKTRLPMEE
jgi:DNA invertase Pin-like site-specific DNA recombinase